MSELSIPLADAVVTEINDGSWSQEITAYRHFLPRWSLEQLGTIRVSVVPGDVDTEWGDRDSESHGLVVDIAVQKRLEEPISEVDDDTHASKAAPEGDPLIELADELSRHFLGTFVELDDGTRCYCARRKRRVVFLPEHLRQNILTTVATCYFQADQDLP